MNGNGTALAFEDIDESDDEEFEEIESDDESEGVLDVVGNILDPLGIRRIFTGPSRPPLPRTSSVAVSRGLDRATLNTPRGSATLQLPQPVATRDELNQVAARLQTAINRNTTRINAIQGDVKSLSQRVGAAVTESKRDVDRVRKDVARVRRENSAAISRLRRDQSSQATTNMLLGFMMQRQIQDQLASHTHDISHTHPLGSAAVADGTEVAVPSTSKSSGAAAGGGMSSMLFLLPFLMQPQQGGSSSDSMMWLPLMFAFA